MVRQAAVAGKFYTNDPDHLREELSAMVQTEPEQKVIGVVSPHAGYLYSGPVAGRLYGGIRVPDTVLVLGPNHTGVGAPAALSPCGEWLTPLGPVPVNSLLSKLILKHAPIVREDSAAHRFEHSLEVQLPFLQYKNPKVNIAAICLALGDYDTLYRLGQGVAAAIEEFGEEVLIVASSDMNHFESAQVAKAKDDLALARLTALDPEGLLTVCREHGITMCGVVPATVMLVAAKLLGATSSKLVSYTHSGAVTGDVKRVVAYAAVTVA